MPTVKYPNNPNTDTAFVTDDNGKRTRTLKTVLVDGTVDYPSNANSSSCYVTIDGKKQRALMTADISSAGTVEFTNNSNSTKGYVTDGDGKKHRVILTAALAGGGGSAPVIDELNVTPSTSAQTITAPTGTDGYSPVNVSAVTSAIDANITAGNIKDGVSILGVTGNYKGNVPTGTKTITTNGVHDVSAYANADVQVPTTAPAHYIEKTVDANGKLVNSNTMIDLTGVTDIGNNALMRAYMGVAFPNNTTIMLDSLTTISGTSACESIFQNTQNIVKIDLSSLTTISGGSACKNMFDTNLIPNAVVDLSSLTTISGSNACQTMFSGQGNRTVDLSSLTTISGTSACQSMFAVNGSVTVDLSSLTTISGNTACANMFSGVNLISGIMDFLSLTTISGTNGCQTMFKNCSQLTTVKLNALNTMTVQIAPSYGRVFEGCVNMERLELGGLKASTFASAVNQIQYLFHTNTGSTAPNGCTVHFPSNFDPSDPNHTFDASTLTGYPTFGGSASYIHVAFDLPATE